MVSCFFLAADHNLHKLLLIIDINLTFMLGIYNYVCTFLGVHQGRSLKSLVPCTLFYR